MAVDLKREPVTGAHLREAQRALISIFRGKGFPVAWVNRNAIDLLAQANLEYIEWLETHEPEASPVGWLVTCAYRRGLNLLSAQGRRPGSTSIDAVFGLADESTPSPEKEAIDDDRQERLRKAMGFLPQRERKLLSLVYFENQSVREAGRRLGWRKSAADRHHQAALDRLRALVDPSLLSPAGLGLASWVALRGDGSRVSGLLTGPPTRALEGAGAVAEAARSGGRRLGEGARRLIASGDPASVAAWGGAARVAGACGAAVIAAGCALIVGGVPAQPSHERSAGRPAPPMPLANDLDLPPPPDAPPVSAPKHSQTKTSRPPRVDRSSIPERASATARPQGGARKAQPAHHATHQEVEEEFGIEEETEPTPEPAPAPTPAPAQPDAPAPQVRAGGNAPPASGAQVESEFGL